MDFTFEQMYARIAGEALWSMNNFRGNSEDWYLYVFANGSWVMDHCQFIASTNDCISCVPVPSENNRYATARELAQDIEANEDFDEIEHLMAS